MPSATPPSRTRSALSATGGGELEAVAPDGAAHGGDAAGAHRVDAVAELGPQAVERGVAEHLALDPALRGRAPPRSHEEDELAFGNAAQEPLREGGPEEA